MISHVLMYFKAKRTQVLDTADKFTQFNVMHVFKSSTCISSTDPTTENTGKEELLEKEPTRVTCVDYNLDCNSY